MPWQAATTDGHGWEAGATTKKVRHELHELTQIDLNKRSQREQRGKGKFKAPWNSFPLFVISVIFVVNGSFLRLRQFV